MVLTNEQLDELETEFAIPDDDDPDPLDRSVGSLWRLQQRCAASAATNVGRRIAVDAQIEACVAAETLIGG